MTREEKKQIKLQKEKEFIKNKTKIINECFDTKHYAYKQMMKIINKAKKRPLKKEYGFELHHFIPRSYFKKKNKTVIDNGNLYKLTYQEHFLVHYYIYLCCKKILKQSMTMALIQMKHVCIKNTNEADTILLSKIYDTIKQGMYSK